MVRSRFALILLGLLWVTPAEAQITQVTGVFSAQIGAAFGGDTQKTGITPSIAVAILEANGWGAAIDLAHTFGVADEDEFDESRVTTLMLNLIGVRPNGTVRPFGFAGFGVLRFQARRGAVDESVIRTDWGINLGGGVIYKLSDAWGLSGDLRYVRFLDRHDDLLLLHEDHFEFWRTSYGITWSWAAK